MDEGQSDESQTRLEKKPHAEPDDEDPDVKRLKVENEDDFENVEEKPWRTFFVVSAGKTNGAHRDFVKKLEAVGHTEASSPEGCDYVVCFCPRMDMDEALKKMPADKPFILVVMHFNPDHVVAENSRLVNNPDVLLTVDCLFCEGQFLKCERNYEAWDEVKKKLGVSDNQKKDIFKASQTLFYIFLAGKTNDAHRDFVKKLEAVGHTEASSPEGCDYVVCFCPVASRVGTDVNAALNKIPADKPSILVVMHHTFNPDHVVAGSRRLVTKSNVHLTLDCLFYKGHFLDCKRNDEAWDEVKKKLGVSDNQERFSSSSLFNWLSWNKSDQLVGNKEPPVCVKNDAGDKNCAIRPSVGKDCSEAQNKMPVAGQTFVVVLAGETNGAHRDFVKKLEAVGQTEATSPEGCDYVVCFCPVASQVAIDVNEALDRIPADKPSILVVMHHTFSPDHVVAESRRLVNNSHVLLTVDCLFYEGQFLKCERNNAAWDKVKKKVIQVMTGFNDL